MQGAGGLQTRRGAPGAVVPRVPAVLFLPLTPISTQLAVNQRFRPALQRGYRESLPTMCCTSRVFSLQMYSMSSVPGCNGKWPYMVKGLV